MRTNTVWAHCPVCKHRQRFKRIETNHLFHALVTLFTLGIWSISWIALVIGRRLCPWRCAQCNSSEPDFSRSSRSKGEAEGKKESSSGGSGIVNKMTVV